MTKVEYYTNCRGGPWNNTKGMVSWKILDNVMYFQQSKEEEDWIRNISIMPTITKIQGKTIFIPIGLSASWDEIKNTVKDNPCDMYVGYSLGGELASLSSALTGKPAIAFGCPNFFIGNRALFDKVEYYQNIEDIFARIPWVYTKGRNVTILKGGSFMYPPEFDIIHKLSGHEPILYTHRLGALK